VPIVNTTTPPRLELVAELRRELLADPLAFVRAREAITARRIANAINGRPTHRGRTS